MDISSLLQNDTVKGLLGKLGVDGAQSESVVEQAVEAVKSKFMDNPTQMVSLLSSNANDADDNKLGEEVEQDFISRLISKVGLPEGIANQAKGFMPQIMGSITSMLSSSGKTDAGGVASLLGADMGSIKDKLGDLGGDKLKGALGKFF